jgi:hypothetical protein
MNIEELARSEVRRNIQLLLVRPLLVLNLKLKGHLAGNSQKPWLQALGPPSPTMRSWKEHGSGIPSCVRSG